MNTGLVPLFRFEQGERAIPHQRHQKQGRLMQCASERFVTFTNGPTLPREAVELAIDLELKGVSLVAEGDHLVVSPRERLTAADIAAIARWKWHLLALLAYQPPAPAWLQ